ncbi:MAG: AIR synthase-related protein, partial [Clostridium sp.]
EGGILGAIYEVGEASGLTVKIYEDIIPIKEETKKVSKIFNLDPYRLISSGSMIITTDRGEELCTYLKSHGINSAVVGKITNEENILVKNGVSTVLYGPEVDEIYKI